MEEQNLQIVTKKIWKMAKVIYFMLRKGIPKGKLLSALNLLLKRGKIAGKEALHNLIFHHHHHAAGCGDSPGAHRVFHLPFHIHKRRNSGGAPPPPTEEDLMAAVAEILVKSAAASPALPGFGRSPIVRQLRITDSPFPLMDVEENSHVDEAAEEFILKFYRDLMQQNSLAYLN